MKTIGYRDRADASGRIKLYHKHGINHVDRIKEALQDIRGLGNVRIFLIQGRKFRLISERVN